MGNSAFLHNFSDSVKNFRQTRKICCKIYIEGDDGWVVTDDTVVESPSHGSSIEH
jgi:hypothetical protein